MIRYLSISHKRALNPDGSAADMDEEEAMARSVIGEASLTSSPYVLLKTCNRTELYYGSGGVTEEVAVHLFRVTAGLESALIGESAVQGQVKEAYYRAKALRPLTAEMNKLFMTALETGKKVRSLTRLSRGAVSHSLAAIEIIEHSGVNLREKRITVVGVNKLTSDILKFLLGKGARLVFLANRSQIKAHALADPLGLGVYALTGKRLFIAESDIIISATSAPHIIIGSDDVPAGKRLLVIDLAFPRDIDPALGRREEITLYNIRDVERIVRSNIQVRQSEVKRAEAIIGEAARALLDALERRKKIHEALL